MNGHRRPHAVLSKRRALRGSALLALVTLVVLAFTTTAQGAPTITLTPASATNVVGQEHCVTATVTGAVSSTFFVDFTTETTSGSAAAVPPAALLVPADENGQARFCFTSLTPGEVLITAVARATGTMSRPTATATKRFVESLPTDKEQCKDGGWEAFGAFKNQGDCVSFVTAGK